MKHFCKIWACLAILATLLTALPAAPALAEAVDMDIDAEVDGAELIPALEMAGEGDALETVSSKKWKKKVKMLSWYKGGSSVLRVGGYGYIYDIKTGTTIRIKRCGGVAHADVEPATKKDTYKLWKLGHGFSWNRRPVILCVRGKYVACSINTKPHGKQTIRNNGYKGQFCLHMAYSKTHGSHKVDKAHMACVRKAYKWAH